ncbi:MAG TPA: NAD-dependent epimerase/dehydratase family protein [Candidatus Peribacterales bacterium]|nr:NAD-dependent epimerase/dehydratase family protein [Candidatus Peribacterales bacterium]
MKILVTGSAGFIGFHLSQALLARGDEVIGIDNFNPYYDPKLKKSRSEQLEQQKGFTLIQGDICERATVEKAMNGVDRVVHLAAIAGVRHALEHPEEYIRNNIDGFFEVIDAAKRLQIDGLIYASSSSVYGGNTKLPFAENDRTDDQISLYGLNKRENELMAHTYHALHGLPVTGLRFFTVYGEYGRPDMALFLFTQKILNGETLSIFGEGKMQRDWTYVEDIVSGIVAAIDKNYPEEIFNLGSGRKEELMDFVSIIEQSCGKEAKKEFLGMQPGDFRASLADITKAKTILGYEPKTNIAEGIPKFVRWYRAYYNT